jgi:succinate-semialdehyde dehydrogenase/glutarate-semialdehyde dehydrogenase
MSITSINPASGRPLATWDEHSDADVDARLARAAAAARVVRALSFAERSGRMRAAAALLDADKAAFARTMTDEMGKTLRSATAEVEKCAWVCRHYADEAERYLADEPIASNASRSFVRWLPLGPVLAVMPWNFPFWQVFRFAAPALMAGNVGLLKHASNVPGCAVAIEQIFARAGFPDGAFQSLLISAKRTARVIADERVRAVTLTGSDAAGADVGEQAGRLVKKVVLELGGSDPFVVMPSAALDDAIKTAVGARIINNGQSCIAAKRFIVHERVYAEFEARFVDAMARLRVGDPTAPDTDVGPIATERGRAELAKQVDRAVADGARLLTGGRVLDGPGFYYAPTVLADVPASSPVRREELFGPVAMLFRARDLDEAIALANDSPYGLGSSVWTRDESEQRRFMNELDAGQTFVNAMVVSDPRLPFGGVKHSGHGRELGALGIREFMNAKTIYVA